MDDLTLIPELVLAGARMEEEPAPIAGARWYTAQAVGDGLGYRFPAGALAQYRYLTADMLVEGGHLAAFIVHLRQGEDGPRFGFTFGVLNECGARMRIPLEAVNQNRWQYPREGAVLKPMCCGDPLDLGKVDRMMFTVHRKSDRPVRWCITPITATVDAPRRLEDPILPKGPLLDEMGQSTLHEWPAKSRDAHETTERLRGQLAAAEREEWPQEFSRWGGWRARPFRASGYFRTEHDGRRWWLVDPDGCAFWSNGPDCVRFSIGSHIEGVEKALMWLPQAEGEFAATREVPNGVDFLRANFIRAFGKEKARDAWKKITLGLLRRWRFNTVANWSDWRLTRSAGFAYVRPLDLEWKRTPMVFRDFPDVFHPGFQEDVKAYATQLIETRDDPALIGYFLMNEPTWGFAEQTPAQGMWRNTPRCATREKFVEFIRNRHEGEPTEEDFNEFSSIMTEKLFKGMSDACREVDPNHLNLGARYYTIPPDWAVAGMRCFDVFSINCYQERVWPEWIEKLTNLVGRPVLIGEWHFGALDAGLPASGIGHVRDQAARGQAFRIYLESAAALPGCVGAHWFQLYDESALGRHDGENCNIGFLDVCNRPYGQMIDAALLTNERLYRVALGELKAVENAPEYLPLLFC